MTINDLLQSVCNEDDWDNFTWSSNAPNFSRCFQHTISTWIPCSFLLLFAIFEIFSIKQSKVKQTISWNLVNSTRLFVTITALITNFVECIFYVTKYFGSEKYSSIFFVSSALKVVTFVVFVIILFMQRSNGVSSVFVTWIFLLLHILCYLPTISQLFLHGGTFLPFEYSFATIYTRQLLLLLLLCSISDSPKTGKERLLDEDDVDDLGAEEFVRPPCPEGTASVPSRLSLWWFANLIYSGYKKPLVTNDLFDLDEEDKIGINMPVFEKNWYLSGTYSKSDTRRTTKTHKGSIISTILKTFWVDLMALALFDTISTTIGLLSPLLLQFILRFMQSNQPTWHGIVIVAAMFLRSMTSTMNSSIYSLRRSRLEIKMQSCFTNFLFKKSFIISTTAKKTATSGEVINLIQVDSRKILRIAHFCIYAATTPITVLVSGWMMYNQVGLSSLAGLVVIAISLPITYLSSKFATKYEEEQTKLKDQRIKYLNETLSGMKVLKLYAWEPSFIKVISDIRNKEMNAYKKESYVYGIQEFYWQFTPFIISLLTFAIYLFSDSSNSLNAEKIFVTINLFGILNGSLSFLPEIVSFLVMARVSVKRVNDYLNAEELEGYVTRNDSKDAVTIKGGHFLWESSESSSVGKRAINSNEVILSDINLNVKKGSLHAIVGKVGSGKSSLLSAILGEMEKISGSVNIGGNLKIAYVPQQAWIENLTLRDNILFGKDYCKEKFDKILSACALIQDLEILPAGDLTEIGEKGVNLSGGQKQRVSLARACYSDADLFLFDDPLSAVDAHVAKHLFRHLFSSQRGILKDKTCILVTNSVDVLPKVDFITVLKEGEISEQGTYVELMQRDSDFADFVNQFLGSKRAMMERQISTMSNASENMDEKQEEKKRDTLIEEESTEVGIVKLSVYKEYLKMIPTVWIVLIFITTIAFHVTEVASKVWMSKWSSDNNTGNPEVDVLQRNYRFQMYALIGVAQMIALTLGNIALTSACFETSIKLHRKLLSRVFRSPMSFFETTPLGRILNRFSQDMDRVDTSVPHLLRRLVRQIITLFVSVAIIASQTGLFTLVILPLFIPYYFLQKIYIPASKQLRRLYSTTSSPIYAHFTQILQGVSTIRAFNENDRFIRESDKRMELNLICLYCLHASYLWLSSMLSTLGSIMVFFVGLYAVLHRDTMTAGTFGLIISCSFTVTRLLDSFVYSANQIQSNFVSVERINEYCNNEMEAELENDENRPPNSWPEKGDVKFENFAARYRPGLDLVLNDVSVSIDASEKVGIVGRTGAGKSTITLSVFRIIEAVKGRILIDNLNIANIGLHDLRSKITIIPQDPVLFSGTLRFNLDPFELYSDDQIQEALKQSHLEELVLRLDKGLLHQIGEGGDNLSVGQKQLMCLARALLRKTKILILDEATASVDLETDSLIQETIKREFKDCTVLTIAHRIQTILNCDRVMVIDKGSIVEFGSPSSLLCDESSTFFSLAKSAGIVV